MARTVLQIVNEALRRVGVPAILQAEYDTPTLPTTKMVQEQYPNIVNEVLRMHKWACATARAVLSTVSVADDEVLYPGWHRYIVPANCIKIVSVSCMYEREGAFLLCAEEGAILRYIDNTVTPSFWDELLIEAVVLRLSWKMALIVVNNKDLAAMYAQEYSIILERARQADGKDKVSPRSGDAKWSSL